MRSVAHVLPAEFYDQMEAHLVSGLRHFDRATMTDLVSIGQRCIELLSGEWRRLFAVSTEYRKIVDPQARRARMLVPPESNPEFVEHLHKITQGGVSSPLVLGAVKLLRILESEGAQGVLILEEDNQWEAETMPATIIALRPQVFRDLLEDIQELQTQGELNLLRRLFSDHCDAEIEFSPEGWNKLRGDARIQAPELIDALNADFSAPEDFTVMRELLGTVGSPESQPSLDAWLRVHGDSEQYALLFHRPEGPGLSTTSSMLL